MGISIQEMENNEQLIKYEVPGFISDKNKNVGNKEEDFEVLQVLGEGNFSQVLKVKSKKNFGFYALKKVDKSKAENLIALENEEKFLLKLNHENIVKCYNVFKDEEEKYIFFIMELMNNGDLDNFLEGCISLEKHAPEPLLWKIFYSCLLGLQYIHDEDIIHRDIKPKNLFLDENLNVKIGDFNISACNTIDSAKKFSGSDDPNKYNLIRNNFLDAGTPEYKAPEVSYNINGYGSKIDIYSLGTTFFELCYHKNHNRADVDKCDYMSSDLYSEELNNLIERMICEEEDERISTSDARKIAKKYYIKKYVKNSSTIAILRCLNRYDNFIYKFYDVDEEDPKYKGKEIVKCVKKLFSAIKINNKDEIDDISYDLRLELVKLGLNVKRDDVEIDPGSLIFYILSRLNSELNEIKIDPKNPINRTNDEYIKMSRNYRIPKGNEENFFMERIGLYNIKELSLISRNFYNYIITDIICEKCNDSGRHFSQAYFLPLNVDIFSKKMENNNLHIKNAFNCLLNDKIQINPKKEKICKNCKEKNELFIKKKFYHTGKNLIIIFDRG